MPHDLISAVIPNRDGVDLLRRILPPLLRELPPDAGEVVVVDDASEDDSVAMLGREFPSVRVVALRKNVGFGEACNLGFREARHPLVLLLNSDMEVTPGSIERLRLHLADPEVFAVGPECRSTDPSQPAPRRDEGWSPCMLGAPAGGGLFRRDLFLQLGGFDPLYAPFYWEDFDLGWVAWREGWKILFEPRAEFLHLESATIRKLYSREYVERVRARNRCLFGWKNLRDPRLRARFLARSFARGIHGLVFRRSGATLLGVLDSVPRIPAARRSRRPGTARRDDSAILRDTNTGVEHLQRL